MYSRARRVRSTVAALAPLLGLALFWAVFGWRDRDEDYVDKIAGATVVCGLGPVGVVLVGVRWSLAVMAVLFVVVWGSYVTALCLTRMGLAPWGVHAGLSATWCLFGLFGVPQAALSVT